MKVQLLGEEGEARREEGKKEGEKKRDQATFQAINET